MTVRVELRETSGYDVLIEDGAISKSGEILRALPKLQNVRTFAIVSDDNVAPLYCGAVADSLGAAGFDVHLHEIPAGEKSKCAAEYFALVNGLAERKITRTDAIIALGGGVVGDLTGFAAATYLRGVPFVQIPTTLLAMVDSSVGGKTGIDIPAGKNLAGAFHQPAAVICDPQTLKTLSAEIFADGMAEVIKHGIIRSAELLRLLQSANVNLPEIIAANVRIKRDIVQRDEFDTGERQLLNFGHTIGHAIEQLSGYAVSHGKAVAIGMSMITRAAAKKGICPPSCVEILHELLQKYDLPCETDFPAQEIFAAALTDKKRAADTLTEVVPIRAGHCELRKIPVNELMEWIG